MVTQSQTDLCRSPDPPSYLAKPEALLLLSDALIPMDQVRYHESSKDIPPEEPPHESSWFIGFIVEPMILLTVSPS